MRHHVVIKWCSWPSGTGTDRTGTNLAWEPEYILPSIGVASGTLLSIPDI